MIKVKTFESNSLDSLGSSVTEIMPFYGDRFRFKSRIKTVRSINKFKNLSFTYVASRENFIDILIKEYEDFLSYIEFLKSEGFLTDKGVELHIKEQNLENYDNYLISAIIHMQEIKERNNKIQEMIT